MWKFIFFETLLVRSIEPLVNCPALEPSTKQMVYALLSPFLPAHLRIQSPPPRPVENTHPRKPESVDVMDVEDAGFSDTPAEAHPQKASRILGGVEVSFLEPFASELDKLITQNESYEILLPAFQKLLEHYVKIAVR